MDEKQVADLVNMIKLQVDCGFLSDEDIVQRVFTQFEDYFERRDANGDWEIDPFYLEDHARQLIKKAMIEHHFNQATWNHMTDCDKLDEAFADLDRNGIVARQNFTCCQSSGHTEINHAIITTLHHRPVRGYAFFHWQDTESAVRSGYLYLAFRHVEDVEGLSELVAREIVAVLRKYGLEADWNGDVKTHICVKGVKWQRRRLSDLWLSALG